MDATAKSSRGGSPHKLIVWRMLLELFGGLGELYEPEETSKLNLSPYERCEREAMTLPIMRPSLSMIGLTTPDTFFRALSSADILSWFIPRFLVIDGKYGLPSTRPGACDIHNRRQIPIPESLIWWIKRYNKLEDTPLMVDDPAIIPITKDAGRAFNAYWTDYLEETAHMEASGNTAWVPLLNRMLEIAQRISLIVALSCNH